MIRRIVPAFLFLGIAGSQATSAAPVLIASSSLGFSGATLIVQSSGIDPHRGEDHRVLILETADGKRIAKALHDAGGHLGNSGLNLYSVSQGRFMLLSEKDCLSIEAVKGMISTCQIRPPCDPKLGTDAAFLGRFDWMNGFDRPRGAFDFGFRYLPFYDATCSG
jgi:hypothetical protein